MAEPSKGAILLCSPLHLEALGRRRHVNDHRDAGRSRPVPTAETSGLASSADNRHGTTVCDIGLLVETV